MSNPNRVERIAEAVDYHESYVEYCRKKYDNMRILTMPKPLELTHIFTQVRVADRVECEQVRTETAIINDMVLQKDKPERSVFSAVTVASSKHRCLLLGRPGSGKSTFLKFFLLKEIHLEQTDKIPIYIALNELESTDQSLLVTAIGEFKITGVLEPDEVFLKLCSLGRIRFLIDGLDELRSNRREEVIREMNIIMNEYHECSFVVTCRTAAYEYWFGNFYHYEIRRFERRSIISFVLRWFNAEKARSKYLLRQILNDMRMMDLCGSPLLLTIVCIAFDAGVDISHNRAEIYKDAIDALLKKWDATRNIYRDNPYRQLSGKRREDLLSDLAVRTFLKGQIAISDKVAESIVDAFLNSVPKQKDDAELDSAAVLKAIEVQHGLIERKSLQHWSFAHLTFQEYFVASYLVSCDESIRNEVTQEHIFTPEWKEVIVLTATLLTNCDVYMINILNILCNVGYGEYFVNKLKQDIAFITNTVQFRRFQKEEVLEASAESNFPHLRQQKFGVIEGGFRLNLEEIHQILQDFRSNVAARGAVPEFEKFHIAGSEIAMALAQILPSSLISDSVFPESFPIDLVLPDILSISDDALAKNAAVGVGDMFTINFMNNLFEITIARQMSHQSAVLLRPRTRDEVIAMAAAIYLLKDNWQVWYKLSASFTMRSVYELTSRKHMFVSRICAEECINHVRPISKELKTDNTVKIVSSAQLARRRKSGSLIKHDIKDFIEGQVIKFVNWAAEKNENNNRKLKAFVAGDAVAEIILSEAFLTPSVRDAAVRTLHNMINNVPVPPDLPPATEINPEQKSRNRRT